LVRFHYLALGEKNRGLVLRYPQPGITFAALDAITLSVRRQRGSQTDERGETQTPQSHLCINAAGCLKCQAKASFPQTPEVFSQR
jgi:hypothetical protein